MEKLMTAKELSQFLQLSESTVYKLASNREIPGVKIGDSWRFEPEEIKRLIRESSRMGKKQRDPVEKEGKEIGRTADKLRGNSQTRRDIVQNS